MVILNSSAYTGHTLWVDYRQITEQNTTTAQHKEQAAASTESTDKVAVVVKSPFLPWL